MKIYYTLLILSISFTGFAQLEKKETFHLDGTLKRIFHINKNNLKEGEDIEYHYGGVIAKITLWDNGMLRDSIIKYNRDGTIYSTGYVRNDSLVFYRISGIKEYEVALKNGRENGTAVHYDDEGKKITAFTDFSNGEKDGYTVYLNEQTNFPEYIAELKDKGHGLLMSFYDNGHIRSLWTGDTFNDGKVISFHDNGRIKEIGNTVEGKADGWKFIYDRDGNLVERVLYEKGQVIKK